MAISIHSLHFSATSKPKPYERKNPPPIFISTNPSHLNLLQLRDLFNSTNLSCHRFPQFNSDGRVKPVDLDKLQIALAHSSVIVSVFCRTKFSSREENDEKLELGFGELFQRAIPVSESNGQLVGFGRAVSDNGLTASIYDVAPRFGNFIARRAVCRDRIQTINFLRKRGMMLVDHCPLCLKDGESVDHLFMHCSFTCQRFSGLTFTTEIGNWSQDSQKDHKGSYW
ncbi:acyl-CoA N-acyltransferases (NAT) superfamily protein isoform X2 [Tasmannia lanceolata]|uniref:acyl-CoA N-acyltransferases (NAT) superfamily protein isoform X2 n=1 Tax=Tasmannia lanceolata TaxID=3420 RepID=UPI004064B6A2